MITHRSKWMDRAQKLILLARPDLLCKMDWCMLTHLYDSGNTAQEAAATYIDMEREATKEGE